MAKHLEVINDDGSICIDDAYKNLELLDVVEMKNSKKTLISESTEGKMWEYSYSSSDDAYRNGLIYGIGLSELAGKSFCIVIGEGVFHFFDPKSRSKLWVERDDVVAAGKIYIFGHRDRNPSTGLAGIEIYNADGKVVYTSDARYLDVLACGSDETTTVEFTGDGVCALELGSDQFLHIWISHHVGVKGIDSEMHPYFKIENGKVTIQKIRFNDIYVAGDEPPEWEKEDFAASYTYGWLVGQVI